MLQFNKKKISKLVIYTVLLGDKEPLGNPVKFIESTEDSDLDIDFVCFTDNHDLLSDVWRFEYIERKYLPADKLSRRPKALPHEYLSQYDISLYVDNIVTFKRLPNSLDMVTDSDYLFRAFPHAYRTMMTEEADAVALLGYEDIKTICNQLDFYENIRPLSSITPLSTCTVILRSHNHPKLIEFGVLWWENILQFSRRDQLSFDFCVLETECKIHYLKGTKHDNDLIHNMDNMDDRRIKSSFDPIRYAWRHRHDPNAVSNPNLHFLNNPQAKCSDFSKKNYIFDYICYKAQSSLGCHVSPRRSISNMLNDIFEPYRGMGGRLLLVHIQSHHPLRFEDDEFESAKLAIAMMLNNFTGSWLSVDESSLQANHSLIGSNEGAFDVIVVLGLTPQKHECILDGLFQSLNSDHGIFLVVMLGIGEIKLLEAVRSSIAYRLQKNCQLMIMNSYHDDVSNFMPNSLICYKW